MPTGPGWLLPAPSLSLMSHLSGFKALAPLPRAAPSHHVLASVGGPCWRTCSDAARWAPPASCACAGQGAAATPAPAPCSPERARAGRRRDVQQPWPAGAPPLPAQRCRAGLGRAGRGGEGRDGPSRASLFKGGQCRGWSREAAPPQSPGAAGGGSARARGLRALLPGRGSRSMKVEFAPINIPLARRVQTAAVFQWVFSFLLLGNGAGCPTRGRAGIARSGAGARPARPLPRCPGPADCRAPGVGRSRGRGGLPASFSCAVFVLRTARPRGSLCSPYRESSCSFSPFFLLAYSSSFSPLGSLKRLTHQCAPRWQHFLVKTSGCQLGLSRYRLSKN